MAGMELLSDQGFRIDGRRSHELRKIECRMGVFDQADGSAYIEQGNTRVLAAVYGPHEVSVCTHTPSVTTMVSATQHRQCQSLTDSVSQWSHTCSL